MPTDELKRVPLVARMGIARLGVARVGFVTEDLDAASPIVYEHHEGNPDPSDEPTHTEVAQ